MSGLLSKVLAGGLSAGIFVLWWPAHAPAQGAEWLLLRGVLWTLAFELLLLAFRPLEHAVAGAVRARDVRAVAPSRLARMLAFAAVAAAVPAAMLSGERAPIATPARAAAPKVVVKREIVRREVVVRRVSRVVRVPAPAAATLAPDAGTVVAPTRAQRSTPRRTTPTATTVARGTTATKPKTAKTAAPSTTSAAPATRAPSAKAPQATTTPTAPQTATATAPQTQAQAVKAAPAAARE